MTEQVQIENHRYHDMDFIRAAAMLLGLILHVCIFFMPPQKLFWGTGEYVGDEVNLQLLNFIHLFRMQLFFMMAGFFAQLVIDRKGYWRLVWDRIKRVLIPFLAGVLILMPVHLVLMNGGGVYYNNAFDGMGLLECFKTVSLFGLFDAKPGIKDTLIHFWFLFYLILIYIIHFALRPIFRLVGIRKVGAFERVVRIGLSRRFGFLALAALTFPFQYLLIRIFFPASGFNVPVINLAFYAVFYLFGMRLYANRDLLRVLAKNSWFLLVISLPFLLLVSSPTDRLDLGAPVIRDITTWTIFDTSAQKFVWPMLHFEGIFHSGWAKVVLAFVRASLCWTLCLGFLGLAHRLLAKPSPSIRYLADSAYWVYWVHLPITFKLSYLGQQVPWGSSLFRSFIVLVVSTFLVYWSYNKFVRYTWLGNFFMGRKKIKSDPLEEGFMTKRLVKRCLPAIAVVGSITFVLGAMLDYDNSRQGSEVLVEAYTTKDSHLLESTENIHGIRDLYGNTPLHNAVRRNENTRTYDPIPVLLEKSSEVNATNDFGRTPLFVAVRSANRQDVLRLLKAGADPNIGDSYGHTPAHVAAIKSGKRGSSKNGPYTNILEDLSQYGADLKLTDYRGRSVDYWIED
ncbi:MAG: hypothetical protein CBB78_008370 [Roseibacillus sp. TMED18]|nr:MAG: hypothetical protein CBB78_008370 [Roseibacillus sp. TMED18]